MLERMADFRIDTIEALARQMTFTPADTRLHQLASAEALLHDIDPAKAYPLDFVIFRITGYHPKTVAGDLLTGLGLQHDLGVLIERLSETLEIHTARLQEPVLSIDDVTEKFNVTSKTVQRWRRRGLPARRFVFPDGKRRVGFLLSSVDRFFASHRDQVAEATNFSQVGDDEREQILQRAWRLANESRCCIDEIARRIARKLHRSPLTILHTIRKHDAEHPEQAIFPHAAEPVCDVDRGRILRGVRQGLSIGALAKSLGHTRQAIYRVVMEQRIAQLTARKVRFIDDSLYHQPDAESVVQTIASSEELAAATKAEELRIPRDLPPYLQDLYRTALLSQARERALFLKFNYHKFRFKQARRKLEPQFARVRELNEMEAHLHNAVDTKNQIIQANLRLVVSVARKHLRPGMNLMELISDGNITLMRAVEGFDIHKGYRFSTYATLALMKGFARSVPLLRGPKTPAQSISHDEMLAELPDVHPDRTRDAMITRDQVKQLLSRLNQRERDVLMAHYGVSPDGADAREPATYEQVGERLGLSKQRVRQIEQTALAKLRHAAN
jgi:RNA polymerase sigma factor (sigma-70 family)